MAANTFEVSGIRELDRAMARLEPRIARRVLSKAVAAGAGVVRKAARAAAPVGRGGGTDWKGRAKTAGTLRRSISVYRLRGTGQSVSYAVGPRAGSRGFYARFVELGTRPHVIKARRKGFLAIGGAFARRARHPGARPQPFLGPALESSADQALAAMAARLRAGIEAEAAILRGR